MGDKIETAAEAHEADAMPRVHEVHADAAGAAKAPPLPDSLKESPVTGKTPAQWAFERLILYIQNFEEQLDNEHEVAMGFAGSDAGVLRIEGMGYFDPDIVTFYGTDTSGLRTQLVQHVSQLSVILRAMPKAGDGGAPKRIGFRLAADLEPGPTAPGPDAGEDADGG